MVTRWSKRPDLSAARDAAPDRAGRPSASGQRRLWPAAVSVGAPVGAVEEGLLRHVEHWMLQATTKGVLPDVVTATMDKQSVERWFSVYLAEFIVLGRGGSEDVQGLIRHYNVPLLLSTDAGCRSLADERQVLAFTRQQVNEMRSANYDRSQELAAETLVLNGSCAIHRGLFSRLRSDGTEITKLEVTYLITGGAEGHRISAIVVHSAQ